MMFFLEQLKADHRAGRRGGAVSICSSHPEVLAAAVCLARDEGLPLLVEATAAQVNPQGGYSGMTPAAFSSRLTSLAEGLGLGRNSLVLGADHLGPYVWRNRPAAQALDHAAELARQCVAAGFRKLHLDLSAACADDPPSGPDLADTARRTAILCRAAEEEASRLPTGTPLPLYVVGSDVPPPGGRAGPLEEIAVTRPEHVAEFLARVKEELGRAGLEKAWERVLAVVVQPGVEFGHAGALPYRPEKAAALSVFHDRLPGIMTYEVHSTDYQPAECLGRLIADHFLILKVGPCLTDAYREALFLLEEIESALAQRRPGITPSGLRAMLARAMRDHPEHWRDHYRGSEGEIEALLLSSRLDRVRYYWARPEVEAACSRLLANLSPSIPEDLAKEFLACGIEAFERSPGPLRPAEWIRHRVQQRLRPYLEACR